MDKRVEHLEEKMDEVCHDIKLVLSNHLPHIQADLAYTKGMIKVWTWLIGLVVAGVVGLVIEAIVNG